MTQKDELVEIVTSPAYNIENQFYNEEWKKTIKLDEESHTGPALFPGDKVDEFVVKKYLDSGYWKEVYLAEDTLTKDPVVIKTMQITGIAVEQSKIRNLISDRSNLEKEALQGFNNSSDHLTLPKLRENQDFLYLVEEYLPGGSLDSFINSENYQNLDIHTKKYLAFEITKQIAKGVSRLNKAGKLHCDLKPDNIMFVNENIVEEPWLKVVDYGSTTRMADTHEDDRSNMGFILTRAKEAFGENSFHISQSNSYAIASIFYKLISDEGKYPLEPLLDYFGQEKKSQREELNGILSLMGMDPLSENTYSQYLSKSDEIEINSENNKNKWVEKITEKSPPFEIYKTIDNFLVYERMFPNPATKTESEKNKWFEKFMKEMPTEIVQAIIDHQIKNAPLNLRSFFNKALSVDYESRQENATEFLKELENVKSTYNSEKGLKIRKKIREKGTKLADKIINILSTGATYALMPITGLNNIYKKATRDSDKAIGYTTMTLASLAFGSLIFFDSYNKSNKYEETQEFYEQLRLRDQKELAVQDSLSKELEKENYLQSKSALKNEFSDILNPLKTKYSSMFQVLDDWYTPGASSDGPEQEIARDTVYEKTYKLNKEFIQKYSDEDLPVWEMKKLDSLVNLGCEDLFEVTVRKQNVKAGIIDYDATNNKNEQTDPKYIETWTNKITDFELKIKDNNIENLFWNYHGSKKKHYETNDSVLDINATKASIYEVKKTMGLNQTQKSTTK